MIETITTEQLLSSDAEVLVLVEQLRSQYPTESDCFEKLCAIEDLRIVCQYCGSEDNERKPGDRSFVCGSCRKKSWVTSGSFFEHTKKLFPWLLLIFLREKGININSNRFSKLACIAPSTAQGMYKKLSLVVEDYMTNNRAQVMSIDFLYLYGKRSRLTPACEHPVSEQLNIDKKTFEQGKSSNDLEKSNLNRLQKKVLDAISDTPIHIDALSEVTHLPIEEISACLVILELEELVSPRPGATYVRRIPASSIEKFPRSNKFPKNLRATVKTISKFIAREFHRVSRKYIQLYLSAIWSQLDLDTWGNGKLLLACQRFGKVPSLQIRNYDSPVVLKLWV